MEPDQDLNPEEDDLPLRANTNHILVRHYVLDLTVHFDRKVIGGSIVLFLEPCPDQVGAKAEDDVGAAEGAGITEGGGCQDGCRPQEVVEHGAIRCEKTVTRMEEMSDGRERDKAEFQALSGVVPETESLQSSHLWETTSGGDFTLVLDCCDLHVSSVEEVDVTSVSSMSGLLPEVSTEMSGVSSLNSQATFVQNLISMPSSHCRQKCQLFLLSSRAPGVRDGSSLQFRRDRWSLQVRKKGVTSPQEFPRALRICYETRPTGGSVRWTKDQNDRFVIWHSIKLVSEWD